jgi:hypothetical protein
MNARRVARPDSVGVIAVLAMTHMLCLRPQPRPYSMSFCRPSHSASARSRASGREPVACTRVSSQQAGRPRVRARTGRRSLGSARVRAAARGLWAGPGRARTGSSARTLSRRCHRVREPGRGPEPTQPKKMRLRASAGRRPRPRCAASARPPPPLPAAPSSMLTRAVTRPRAAIDAWSTACRSRGVHRQQPAAVAHRRHRNF